MQKAVVEKQVQKEQRYMGSRLTLHMTYTPSWSSIIQLWLTLITKLSTKLIKESFIIFHVGRSWLIILEGKQTLYRCQCTNFLFFKFILRIATLSWGLLWTFRPKALSAVKPYYTFAVHRTGLPGVKPIFLHKHFCPCPPCTTGDFHRCIYTEFLGMSQLFPNYSFRVAFPCACIRQLTGIANTFS